MYQLICGLALVGITVGSAQANMTFVKEDESRAVLIIPEDQTASVYQNEEKLLSGRTILDDANAKNAGRNAIRLVPDEDSACPPVIITFQGEYASLEVMTAEMARVRGTGTCAIQTIGGRYHVKRHD